MIHELGLFSVIGLLTHFQLWKAVTLVGGQGWFGEVVLFGWFFGCFLKAGREVFFAANSVELM